MFNRFNKSSNPFMKEKTFVKSDQSKEVLDNEFINVASEKMTVSGAVNKTFILAGIMMMTAFYGYYFANPLFTMGGAIGGLIVVIFASFKPHLSPTLAPIYAALEGLFVGGISAAFAGFEGGIIFQAITLTLGVLFTMLAVYKSGLIVVTDKFRKTVVMAMGAIFLVYIANFVMSFFGMSVPHLHEATPIGIAISIGVIIVASLMLLVDFDMFERGEKEGAPKYMEWYCGMGLLITLVWLYVEILRLVAMFAGDE